ncbi:hypothetical protein HYT05_00950 [Candidatus Kaiserbacteria bacterium]|nr:hypothetical protein [Candidatus Kaiserbacteria bacterium]
METKKKRMTLNDLGEMLTHVVKHMATKEELAEVKEDLATVKNTMATASELDIVRRDVEIIKKKTESHDGFAKEIDHTISRIVVIEKHLGIST